LQKGVRKKGLKEKMQQETINEFGYYLNSMLQQLAGLFPECSITAGLSAVVTEAMATREKEQVSNILLQWRNTMSSSAVNLAIEAGNFEQILENNIPILDLMQIRKKLDDSRLSENSKKTLLRFVQTLQRLAVPQQQQVHTDTRLESTATIEYPRTIGDDALGQLPPEMAPLINLARSFIQKMPEDEVNQMFSNIASIGQTVMKNYDGAVPAELGGDYFTEILRKTFQ
jgi:hypothetical protein